MTECQVCNESDSKRYVRRLRKSGYDSVWALKSVKRHEDLEAFGIDKKIHRIRLFRLLQEPAAIPDAKLPVSSVAAPYLTELPVIEMEGDGCQMVDFVRRVLHINEGLARSYCKTLLDIGCDIGESFLM